MSEIEIRPTTVEYDDSVVVTYLSPKRSTRTDGEDFDHYRPFTLAELEDVLIHARMHDATDDHYVILADTYRGCAQLTITLPKHWSDVSEVPKGRYAPVRDRFWYGWTWGAILITITLSIVYGLFL